MRSIATVTIETELTCESGLHIGNESPLEIRTVNSVVTDPYTGYPYIPASSLKGKLRSLLEWDLGKVSDDGSVHSCSTDDIEKCPICRLFGDSADQDTEIGPTRLTVRDAHPTKKAVAQWEKLDTTLPYTEVKKENTINRLDVSADPRSMERIPKGSTFNCEFVYSVFDLGEDDPVDVHNLNVFDRGLELLENDSLGGSGSRGYGKVSFGDRSYSITWSLAIEDEPNSDSSNHDLDDVIDILEESYQ